MTPNNTTPLHRLLVKGGIISPGEFLRVIELARRLGQNGIHFGSRQDILFASPAPSAEVLADFPEFDLEPLHESQYANIVCSYASAEIFRKTPWLTSSTFLYILEQFSFQPRLEINITDPNQRLTPLFTGHLNFIAAPREEYWYCYVRLPGWETLEPFPALIHSWDIATVAEAIDRAGTLASIDEVVTVANQGNDLNLRNIDEELAIPFYPFPYYEGMNRINADAYWLGLYWRNNWYDLDFMEAACRLCLEHRIGKLCITSWKSFIVSGLPADRRIEWEKLLGRFGINARHSSLELNWHLPVADKEALNLKSYLVRAFDQRDISTYGLTFGITSGYSRPFTSIVIEPERLGGLIDGHAVRPTYNIHHARNFDPNTRDYVEYARQVDRSELVELMVELSRLYFAQLDEGPRTLTREKATREKEKTIQEVWQCGHCLSVYDPEIGDPAQDVPAGTSYASLPEEYSCWTCGAGKEDFTPLEMESIQG